MCSGRFGIYWSGLARNKWHFWDYGYSLLYIHVNIRVYKICWLDLGTFSVHVLRSDICTIASTHAHWMNFFILLSKTNKINIYFQLLRDKKKELSIKIDPTKSKSNTTNRSSKKCSRTNVIISHSSTFEAKKQGWGSWSRFIKSISTDQLKAR